MKSKYAPLVKLKKQNLDRAERDLIGANNALASASDALEHAYQTLSQLSLVQKGAFSDLISSQVLIQTQHEIIDHCRIALEEAQMKQAFMRDRYKEAMIDFEKFKYLEVEEAKKMMAKIKKEEAKMLDEIGTMSFSKGDE